MTGHGQMLAGVDADKVLLDVFLTGFRSGAASAMVTLAGGDHAIQAADVFSLHITDKAANDPLIREEALTKIKSVLRCHTGACNHHTSCDHDHPEG